MTAKRNITTTPMRGFMDLSQLTSLVQSHEAFEVGCDNHHRPVREQSTVREEPSQLLNPAFRKTTTLPLCRREREQLSKGCCVFPPARSTRWCARRLRWEFWQYARNGQDQFAGKQK